MNGLNQALENLSQAWEDAGPVPSYHYEQKVLLQRNWSTLYNAICDVLDNLE